MEDRNEKLQQGEIVLPKSKWTVFLENAWYHYKWHIIIISFFVTVFAVCIVQCASRPRSDVVVSYAGGYVLSSAEVNSINQIFTDLLNDTDTEGDRSIVSLSHYSVYTEKELYDMYHEEGVEVNGAASLAYNSAKQANIDHISHFSSFLLTGESAVLLVSEWVYETKILPERMMTLESVLGSTPAHAVDAYAVRLCDTAIYHKYDVLQLLPEDTLVVLAQPTFAGATSNDEVYELHKKLFCKIAQPQP